MSAVHSRRVVVNSPEDFERLLAHPASISGEYDPESEQGLVTFPTFEQACAARRELDT